MRPRRCDDDEVFLPSAMARRSLDWLDDGRLVELPEGTHWIAQEHPKMIGSLLDEFFRAP